MNKVLLIILIVPFLFGCACRYKDCNDNYCYNTRITIDFNLTTNDEFGFDKSEVDTVFIEKVSKDTGEILEDKLLYLDDVSGKYSWVKDSIIHDHYRRGTVVISSVTFDDIEYQSFNYNLRLPNGSHYTFENIIVECSEKSGGKCCNSYFDVDDFTVIFNDKKLSGFDQITIDKY